MSEEESVDKSSGEDVGRAFVDHRLTPTGEGATGAPIFIWRSVVGEDEAPPWPVFERYLDPVDHWRDGVLVATYPEGYPPPAAVKHEPPTALHLRYCGGCGRSAFPGDITLGSAHNPAWPDASPIVCSGPVRQLTYVLEPVATS